METIWVAITRLGPLREHVCAFLVLIFVAFLLCLFALFRAPLPNNRSVLAMLGFALAFRMTVLPASPDQSEDVYRYLWDARVASMGIDPFRYPPDATEVRHLRDGTIYPMLNSKPYVTAYPPLSQLVFRCSYALFGDRVTPMKAIFSLLEFAALLIAWRILISLRLGKETLYLIGWNPFFIFEFSYSGHSDSGMVFLTLLSVLLFHHCRTNTAMVSYAGAVLSKMHPAFWFPIYARRAGWRATMIGLAAGAILSLAYFTPQSALRYLNSLRLYYRLFEFNAGIHYCLKYIGASFFDRNMEQTTGPLLGAAFFIAAIIIWWKFPVRDVRSLVHAGFWIMIADLCLSTTVHPWYLSWAALSIFLFPYAFMIYWTGAIFLSYIAYSYRPVYEPSWVLLVEYLPMFALMAWEIWRRRPLVEISSERIES